MFLICENKYGVSFFWGQHAKITGLDTSFWFSDEKVHKKMY